MATPITGRIDANCAIRITSMSLRERASTNTSLYSTPIRAIRSTSGMASVNAGASPG